MKKEKKLELKKTTIAVLNSNKMNNVMGGATVICNNEITVVCIPTDGLCGTNYDCKTSINYVCELTKDYHTCNNLTCAFC